MPFTYTEKQIKHILFSAKTDPEKAEELLTIDRSGHNALSSLTRGLQFKTVDVIWELLQRHREQLAKALIQESNTGYMALKSKRIQKKLTTAILQDIIEYSHTSQHPGTVLDIAANILADLEEAPEQIQQALIFAQKLEADMALMTTPDFSKRVEILRHYKLLTDPIVLNRIYSDNNAAAAITHLITIPEEGNQLILLIFLNIFPLLDPEIRLNALTTAEDGELSVLYAMCCCKQEEQREIAQSILTAIDHLPEQERINCFNTIVSSINGYTLLHAMSSTDSPFISEVMTYIFKLPITEQQKLLTKENKRGTKPIIRKNVYQYIPSSQLLLYMWHATQTEDEDFLTALKYALDSKPDALQLGDYYRIARDLVDPEIATDEATSANLMQALLTRNEGGKLLLCSEEFRPSLNCELMLYAIQQAARSENMALLLELKPTLLGLAELMPSLIPCHQIAYFYIVITRTEDSLEKLMILNTYYRPFLAKITDHSQRNLMAQRLLNHLESIAFEVYNLSGLSQYLLLQRFYLQERRSSQDIMEAVYLAYATREDQTFSGLMILRRIIMNLAKKTGYSTSIDGRQLNLFFNMATAAAYLEDDPTAHPNNRDEILAYATQLLRSIYQLKIRRALLQNPPKYVTSFLHHHQQAATVRRALTGEKLCR